MANPGRDFVKIQNEYFRALGHMIHEFARLEAALQMAIWLLAETKPDIAKAVFSGVRADTAVSFIRRLFVAHATDLPARLDRALTHAVAINKARNEIVHYGAAFSADDGENGPAIGKSKWALRPDPAGDRRVSPAALISMTADLQRVSMIIGLECTRVHWQDGPSPDTVPGFYESLDAPWLYVPPEQGHRGRKSLKTPQSPTPQPPSSQG